METNGNAYFLRNYQLLDCDPTDIASFVDLQNNGVHAVSVVETGSGPRLATGGETCGPNDGGAPLVYSSPFVGSCDLGSDSFKAAYHTQHAYYAGSMANAISSEAMVAELGRAGFMGSYGSGGMPLDEVGRAIDRIRSALPEGPFLVNLLHAANDAGREDSLISLYLSKSVRAIEASAFTDASPALIRYRLAGLKSGTGGGGSDSGGGNGGGSATIENRIIAKVSREEVGEIFMSPPNPKIVAALLAKGQVTQEQAKLAESVPVADDITVEADSGGHTDNRPLVSLLPLFVSVRDETCLRFGYRQKIRIGAAGGIGTALSAAGAFQMGADYVVTGSVNQACVEAGTSEYVKQALALADMSDVVMAPSADMFESGARVQVIKKGTMFPMNAQKLYEYYTRYGRIEDIPEKDIKAVEARLFRNDIETVWNMVREYFARVDESQLRRAEASEKYKMALIFRWYLGNSSRWAIRGEQERKMDMQIWCGKSMGAFNRWVRGTALEMPENRTVAAVAKKIMSEAAAITMINSIKSAGVH